MKYFRNIPRTRHREYIAIAEWDGTQWAATMLDYNMTEYGATPRKAFANLHMTWKDMEMIFALAGTYPYRRPIPNYEEKYNIWATQRLQKSRIKQLIWLITGIIIFSFLWVF